jgi:anthranilate synthase component 1
MRESPFNIAADLDTPVSAFCKLGPLQPRTLLESVEGGARVGRYSFIGLGVALEVRLEGDQFSVNGVARPAPRDRQGLMDTLRQIIQEAPRLSPAIPGLPFHGGLIGMTGYDMVRRFERNRTIPPEGPGTPEALYLAPRSVLVFDHVTRLATLLHSGPEAERQELRGRIIELLRGPVPVARVGSFEAARPSFERASFCDAVRRAKEHITAGDVFQLVLSIRMEGRTDLEPFQVYRALRLLNPSPYMVFFDIGGVQVIGSSPEALVKLDGRKAILRQIAGTRPRGADAAEDLVLADDLLADPKEEAEHVMLVDLARNDLGRVAVSGSVEVHPFRGIEHYSHVMHTVSGVEGTLRPELDALDLYAASFPAGTVGGAPKVRAMELIVEMEPIGRGLYAGTVGYFGHGPSPGQLSMDQAITIRTLVMDEGRYAMQAGAGIVADSVPENEHAECLAKAAALGQALELAAGGLS